MDRARAGAADAELTTLLITLRSPHLLAIDQSHLLAIDQSGKRIFADRDWRAFLARQPGNTGPLALADHISTR